MDESIERLSKLLSSPDSAKHIKEILGSFAAPADEQGGELPAPGGGEDMEPNARLMAKMGEIMAAMNDRSDSRITLLQSLRPFMSPGRARRIDEAMRIMQITKLSRFLNGRGGRERDA
ncbi:MAG: hypothetical protein II705_00640 [Clostridia bacterium]|nr:hypothetical protein [Clostridia bacterium]MBQ4248522.1 hypothetical protein [Clostridia bacterium]